MNREELEKEISDLRVLVAEFHSTSTNLTRESAVTRMEEFQEIKFSFVRHIAENWSSLNFNTCQEGIFWILRKI